MLPTTGPHLITRQINLVNFIIKFSSRGKLKCVHIDQIRPYQGEITQEWIKVKENLTVNIPSSNEDNPRMKDTHEDIQIVADRMNDITAIAQDTVRIVNPTDRMHISEAKD